MQKIDKILMIMIYAPPWQYYIKYKNFLNELNHAFLKQVDFCVGKDLVDVKKILRKYKVVAFFHHDPLKSLYPEIYEYAKEIESECIKSGITMINKPEPLSLTIKSKQLGFLKDAGLPVARTIECKDINSLIKENKIYPFFLRYDSGHDSRGEACLGPYLTKKDLKKSVNDFDLWQKVEHFSDVIGIEWLDTKDKNGLYKKYRVFVFGDVVMPGSLFISNDWFVHEMNHIATEVTKKETNDFLYSRIIDSEQKIFKKVNKILGLDFSAIDYGYNKNGDLIIWEANPHPSFGALVESSFFRKNFTDLLSGYYKSLLS